MRLEETSVGFMRLEEPSVGFMRLEEPSVDFIRLEELCGAQWSYLELIGEATELWSLEAVPSPKPNGHFWSVMCSTRFKQIPLRTCRTQT